MNYIDRRQFLRQSGTLGLGAAGLTLLANARSVRGVFQREITHVKPSIPEDHYPQAVYPYVVIMPQAFQLSSRAVN